MAKPPRHGTSGGRVPTTKGSSASRRAQQQLGGELTYALLLASVVASGSSIPAVVQSAAPWLTPVTHVKDMPIGSVPWPIADPGAPYNNSDIRVQGRPNRGLFLAGCTPDLCVMHFQVGGIVSPYCIIAMKRHTASWEPVWYARLPRKLTSFEEMRGILEGGSAVDLSEMSWCNETSESEK